ncbi:unnamed protein product [Meganyctiphanes norvegica]|uniref:PiggyBac transposable element-derived protein domain-containing protein n=1 Tax=Meganyctiphanes norvegica TaxID=48144 RepID=A0AAV2SAV5_MEGNR
MDSSSSVDLAPVHRSTPQRSPSVPRTDGFIRGATVAQVHHLSPDVADPDDPECAASTVSRSPISSSLGAGDVQPDQLITFQADISMHSGSSVDLAPVHRSTPQSRPSVPRRGSSRVRPDVADPDVADPDDPEYTASTSTSRSRRASPDLPAPVRGAGRGRGRPRSRRGRPRSRRGRGRVAVNRDLAATHAPQSAAPPPAACGRGRARAGAATTACGRGRDRAGATAAQPPVAASEPTTATTTQGPRRGLPRPFAEMLTNELRSYKRARADVCEQGLLIKLIDRVLLSKNNEVLWEPRPPVGVESVVDPASIVPGGPIDHVADATTPEQLFSSFFLDNLIDIIVLTTNEKASDIRQKIGSANRENATFSDTNLTEMRCFIGCHIMAGIRKDNHLNTTQMWSDSYGGFFYKSLFSQKGVEFSI